MPDERAALAPCPFCGGMAELRQTRSKVWPMVAVQCAECLALVEAYNDADATAAWERRPPPPPAPAELEKLSQHLEMIANWAVMKEVGEGHDIRRAMLDAAAALRAIPASGVEDDMKFARVVREDLGVAIHTALRRVGNHPTQHEAWDAIRRMPDHEWASVIGQVVYDLECAAGVPHVEAAAPPPGGRADTTEDQQP